MTHRHFPARRARQAAAWLAAASALALAGCGHKAPEAEAARPVIALPAPAAEGTQALRFPGEIHARYEMPLAFRVPGQLISREARLGDIVKKGQELARLDDADADKNEASARAALEAAEHRLTYATQQRDRDEAQAKDNLISQMQLEQTRDAYASALSAHSQAKQQYELARNQRRYNTLVADRDGAITSEHAEVGQVLAAGQAVFGFAWSGERDVYVDVPEDRVATVKPGQAASVSLLSVGGQPLAAHVREVAPAADPQTRTYRVKLGLDAPDPHVRLGMTADVAFAGEAGPGKAVRLPATALFHQGEKPAVWVVRAADSTLELRPVTVLRYGERDVFVGTGLEAGERVVMQGVHAVSAGEKVAPMAPPHAEDSPL
ncbi:efflux RND transporter periplasmic adaptor subunit [Dyella sp. BiH032]|uniref:efflux RND transporter periplasmic adaptor subunit n=1 Tax=Dyella sp. BiH032 TaxID=3075430 RepID=UPI002892C715|nr:efflux RND transporter periplasmic adaptor subunit [Dyella sp. BiH032]WNL47048.1 efflux RND transporter periplasmic adaptor subunit [Dyella sp. BiH032]